MKGGVGNQGARGIEGAKAARLEWTCCRDGERAPLGPPPPLGALNPATQAAAFSSLGFRAAAAAAAAGMALLLPAGGWSSGFLLGPGGMARLQAWWRCSDLVQLRMQCLCPDLRVCSSHSPSPLYPAPRRDRYEGGRKGSGGVVIVAASPGAARALTDLARCSSGE